MKHLESILGGKVMESLLRTFVFISLLLASSQGYANSNKKPGIKDIVSVVVKNKKPIMDLAEKLDPSLQSDEDVLNFIKGKGGLPTNHASALVSGVTLKKPQLGGTGCPEGTISASITPDAKTISLLFDNYIAEAGRSSGVKRDIKNCSVQLPIEVPAGYQFTIVKLDYRGYNSIPDGGRTRYVTMYSFFDGQTNKQIGRRIRRNYIFSGPLEEEYVISSDVTSKPIWSNCGKNLTFRLDTRAIAVTNQEGDDVLATIDSIDASAGTAVEYHLLWRTCNSSDLLGGGVIKPKPNKPKFGF